MAAFIWRCKKCRIFFEGKEVPPKDLTCQNCKEPSEQQKLPSKTRKEK